MANKLKVVLAYLEKAANITKVVVDACKVVMSILG